MNELEEKIPELDDKITEEWLGPSVDITGVYDCKTLHETGYFAFELYKEAATIVAFVAHLLDEESAAKGGFERNQAICAGLMVKVSKFMTAVVQLSTGNDRGEIVMALNRVIYESAINLEFLIQKNEDRYFDQFVELSLGPEAEFYDQVQANIAARKGEVWPIEERILNSIKSVFEISGRKIEDTERKHQNWAENMRKRLEALGKGYYYAGMYRMPSHAIHGNWPDLLTQHLNYDETAKVFQPEPKWTAVESRLLSPVAMYVLASISPYLDRYFGAMEQTKAIQDRVGDLHERLREVERVDEALKTKLREEA